MDDPATQFSHSHAHRRHHRHHGGGSRRHSHHKHGKEVVQRFTIIVFLLLVLVTLVYVWISSGSSEASGMILPSSSVLSGSTDRVMAC